MALDDTDRRRFLLATALTLLALPALWWANQSGGSTAPNVAAVGVDVGDGSATESTVSNAVTPSPEDDADVAPVFLEGPSADVGSGIGEIAVPAPPQLARITTTATYRSSIGSTTCIAPGVTHGATITVVNLDNGRTTTCVANLATMSDADHLVMDTRLFAELADLTDAPIPVEIRQ